MREYTPEFISATGFPENGILVFGSNSQGKHGKGAALFARLHFGAKYGQARGLQGRSYAIITKKNWWQPRSSSIPEIREEIYNFMNFARLHPELKFYVTKIGSSLGGYTVDEIRQIFLLDEVFLTDNIILPKEYEVRYG
jgi:hypothetical protein